MMMEAAKISSLGNDRQRIDRPDTRDLPQKMIIWASRSSSSACE
jgi:hypothetical protein